jgi:hypothetical protein
MKKAEEILLKGFSEEISVIESPKTKPTKI